MYVYVSDIIIIAYVYWYPVATTILIVQLTHLSYVLTSSYLHTDCL